MFKDSSDFVSWASGCNVIRGFQDISIPSSGLANVGDSSMAIGKAGNGVVSLGDGGYAILSFNAPIKDGSGPDFAVFENSFDGYFLELAFIEVSSDGIHYFRFPAISNTDTVNQTGSFGYTEPSLLNNLAGKYKAEYGTPFDLSDLSDNLLLDKQHITHIKVLDVVGSLHDQYCSRDIHHHKVNDPWPTSFGSGGFDLDAVGVIHQQTVGFEELALNQLYFYPNPTIGKIVVSVSLNEEYSIIISNLVGETLLKQELKEQKSVVDITNFASGVYYLKSHLKENKNSKSY